MPPFGVERQYLLGVLSGLGQLAEVKIGDRQGVVSDDQEIRIAVASAASMSCMAQRSDSATRPVAITWI
jgi:hypothetical protein